MDEKQNHLLSKEPDIKLIRDQYERDVVNSSQRREQMRDAFNQRNCIWPNKSLSQRKEYKNAKPYKYASDVETPLIEYVIDSLVAVAMNAFDNGDYYAEPVGADDVENAGTISQFVRWMMQSGIHNIRPEIETAVNELYEYGECAVWCSWRKKYGRRNEEFSIEDIAKVAPEIAEAMMDPGVPEEEVLEMIMEVPGVVDIPTRKGIAAVKSMRKTGKAEIPVRKDDVNKPVVWAKKMHHDVIIPYLCGNPQEADMISVRFLMTAQELLERAQVEGWDKSVVDEVIANHMKITDFQFHGNQGSALAGYGASAFSNSGLYPGSRGEDNMTVVIRTYQRLVDPEDDSEAIYETVWFHSLKDRYAKFGILNGWDEYPIAFQRLKNATRRWSDIRGIADTLRGTQRNAKILRDGTNDQTSMASCPPTTYHAGNPDFQIGAGARIPVYPGDEDLYKFLQVPDSRRNNVELEKYFDEEALKYGGLLSGDAISEERLRFFIGKALALMSNVGRLLYKCYLKYGPEDLQFRITGNPELFRFSKSPNVEELDVNIRFDTRMSDGDWMKSVNDAMNSIQERDVTGRISPDAATDIRVAMFLPQFAGRLLRPSQKARNEVIQSVLKDLSAINLGVQVNADTSASQVVLEFLTQWEQTPRAAEMLQNPSVAQSYAAYKDQIEMDLMQKQNAITGKNVNPNAVV